MNSLSNYTIRYIIVCPEVVRRIAETYLKLVPWPAQYESGLTVDAVSKRIADDLFFHFTPAGSVAHPDAFGYATAGAAILKEYVAGLTELERLILVGDKVYVNS